MPRALPKNAVTQKPDSALLKILAQDGIDARVVPVSFDELVLTQHSFGLEAAFFQDALRGAVGRRDKGLDAVEIQRGEPVRDQGGDGFAGVSLVPIVAVEGVPQFSAPMLRRPADESHRAEDFAAAA